MHLIARRLSPSFIISIAALYLALAGTAAAAVIVDSPDDLRPGVVTTPAIANKAVTAAKLAPGATPNVLAAKVDFDGRFVVGHVALGSQRLDRGTYRVRHNRDVRTCTMTATARESAAIVSIDNEPLNPQGVIVRTKTVASTAGGVLLAPRGNAFDLWGVC